MSSKNKEKSLYKSLFENAYSVMLIVDPETGEILDANKAAVLFYQYAKKDLLGMNISHLGSLPDALLKKPVKAPENHTAFFDLQHQLQNGERRNVEVYTDSIELSDKRVICLVVHDITHRRLAKETIEKSESTIRAMINATHSLVYLFDLKGTILDLNMQGARLFNSTPEEMIGMPIKDFYSENEYSRLRSLVMRVVESKESLTYQREKDDRHFEISLYPVFNEEAQVDRICVFARDITDFKNTEKVFAAIETAGGICHEMNQPLQVILGNLELLKLNIKKDDPNQKFIETLIKYTERLGIITKKLTHITRYETKEYIKGTIFDIDKSTDV